MRILFISPANAPDYQCDMLFHGLRALVGPDVIDQNKMTYMYKNFEENESNKFEQLYGKGFSVYGLLDDIDIDREDLIAKIKRKWFDFIVYGSIHRSQDLILEVLESYSPNNIFFIDGEDESHRIYWPLVGRGHYLKREIEKPMHGILPIQFAIPVEKIATKAVIKSNGFAFIDPRNKSTYIYSEESDYYNDYQSSLFAYTTKKAGWDCLRHYEIMANDSIPIFIDLGACPNGTMHYFPRMEIFASNNLLNRNGIEFFQTDNGFDLWRRFQNQIKSYLIANLTTLALANRLVGLWKMAQ